jgi:hypothetical protein
MAARAQRFKTIERRKLGATHRNRLAVVDLDKAGGPMRGT